MRTVTARSLQPRTAVASAYVNPSHAVSSSASRSAGLLRHLAEAPPSDQEGLGDHVFALGEVDVPPGVGVDTRRERAKGGVELILTHRRLRLASSGCSHPEMSGPVRMSHHQIRRAVRA